MLKSYYDMCLITVTTVTVHFSVIVNQMKETLSITESEIDSNPFITAYEKNVLR